MTTKTTSAEWLILAPCLLALGYVALIWNQLPATIPSSTSTASPGRRSASRRRISCSQAVSPSVTTSVADDLTSSQVILEKYRC